MIYPEWNNNLNLSIRRLIGRAAGNFKMLSDGDNVLIGLSGGKDSLILLHALNELSKYSPVKFKIAALTVKISGMDLSLLREYCEFKNIKYYEIESDIMQIIKIRNEKSPCSLCANIRRGILSTFAAENNFNKLALGHTIDDATETFLLNIFHAGRAKSFKPVSYMSRTKIYVIRPLIYTSENAIIDEVARLNLPVLKTPCPYAGHTKRQEIRELIYNLKMKIPDLNAKIINSLENLNVADCWSK